MKLTQRLVIVIGETSLIAKATALISGFKACTQIKQVTEEVLKNVYHFNKNAVYFTQIYDINLARFNPITIQLTAGKTDLDRRFLNVNNIIEDFPEILDLSDIDVGDHMSTNSSNGGVQSVDNCLLCKIMNRKTQHVEHIVYETENFYVVPGTGAFFNGYLMIVPKSHVMSFALLSEDEISEFYTVLNDIRTLLTSIYGFKIFAFECGSGKSGGGKHETSIVHAHFHLAPTDMPVLREVQKSGLNPAPIEKENLSCYGEYPYMLYVDQDDNWYISSNPQEYYPRQHPRQVLAEYMNDYEHYNWRIFPYRERMDVIADEFRSFCRKNYSKLPEWVQKAIRFED